eukprot:scaffold15_cov354-Prasinococcus_capsulatus_cf.AAC.10
MSGAGRAVGVSKRLLWRRHVGMRRRGPPVRCAVATSPHSLAPSCVLAPHLVGPGEGGDSSRAIPGVARPPQHHARASRVGGAACWELPRGPNTWGRPWRLAARARTLRGVCGRLAAGAPPPSDANPGSRSGGADLRIDGGQGAGDGARAAPAGEVQATTCATPRGPSAAGSAGARVNDRWGKGARWLGGADSPPSPPWGWRRWRRSPPPATHLGRSTFAPSPPSSCSKLWGEVEERPRSQGCRRRASGRGTAEAATPRGRCVVAPAAKPTARFLSRCRPSSPSWRPSMRRCSSWARRAARCATTIACARRRPRRRESVSAAETNGDGVAQGASKMAALGPLPRDDFAAALSSVAGLRMSAEEAALLCERFAVPAAAAEGADADGRRVDFCALLEHMHRAHMNPFRYDHRGRDPAHRYPAACRSMAAAGA